MTDSAEKTYRKLMDRSFRILSRRPHSVSELRAKLLKREDEGVTEELLDRLVERLLELKLLDDAEFVRAYSRHRLLGRPIGSRKLQVELRRKGVSDSLIDEVLDELLDEHTESDLIQAAIEKRIRIKGFPKERAAKAKFYDHLMRRGFRSNLIRDKLFSLVDDTADN